MSDPLDLVLGRLNSTATILQRVNVFYLVFGLSFLIYLSKCLHDQARNVSGPLAARFTSLWYLRQLYAGNFHETNVALHRKYGKIVRVAPNMYSIDDPDVTKSLYGPGTQFIKADWYSVWGSPAIADLNLFALQDAKKHATVRRQYASYYTMSSMVEYEDYINEVVDIFCHKLDEFAETKSTIDIGHWLQCYAFDVISKITFGDRFGFLDAGADIGDIMKSLEQFGLYSTLTGVYPWIHRLISRFDFGQANNYITVFTNTKLKARQEATAQGKSLAATPDFCTKFSLAHEKSPESFTRLNVLVGAASNVAAGSETTSIALASILFNVMNNPKVLERLRRELNEAEAGGHISRPVTFVQTQSLEYFQAVVKEALRLHPSAALPFWRIVPQGGATIAGQYFPQNAVVGINAWVGHRNMNVFGPDADSFRPERWLEASPRQAAMMERYWMPFGQGARTCIGKNISMLEIAKVVPELIQRFDFKQETPEMMNNVNRWFVKQKQFRVMVKSRSDNTP